LCAALLSRGIAIALRHRTLLAVVALGAEIAAVSVWLATYTSQIRDWSVMTDEMAYAKLGLSIATDHPLPAEIHGQGTPVYNLLYPLLLAPFYGSASGPAASHAAHVFNAVVMASAALPVYLIARRVLPRTMSLVAGLLAVLVPWMAYSTLLMTEVVAYPVFLWSALALLWALQVPSWRRDLLALAGLVMAAFARTQFVLLALVFPVALFLHEAGYEAATASAGTRLRGLRAGARRAVAGHPVLLCAYVGGVAYLAFAVAGGSASQVLGTYGIAAHGNLFPDGFWTASAVQIDLIGVGTGLVPLFVGGAWMLVRMVRPYDRNEHALATLGLALVVSLTLETTSFALRFTGEATADRYLFYVAPLLVVATLAALRRPHRLWPAVFCTTAFFAVTVRWLDFPTFRGLWTNSPVRFLNATLVDRAGSVHLATASFLAVVGVLMIGLLALGFRTLPAPVVTGVVVGFLLLFSALATRDLLEQTVSGGSFSGRSMSGPRPMKLDWVDAAIPSGGSAALVPFPRSLDYGPTAIQWWDTEFWNNTATRAFVRAGPTSFSYTPFPTGRLSFDWEDGRALGLAEAPAYVVVAQRDTRFRIAGEVRASQQGLDVIRVDQLPYRAVWQTTGLDEDGWLRPRRPATLRVYAQNERVETLELTIVVRAAWYKFARYTLRAGAVVLTRTTAARSSSTVRVRVCVSPGAPADVTLTGESPVRQRKAWPGRGTRVVTARLGRVSLRVVAAGCSSPRPEA
jgi:hypothetical protein